jgi:hypothetical protein
MANETVFLDFTPPSVRRAQKQGGSTFRGQVENIIGSQVDGLPTGTTFTVGTIPGGAAPLIQFVGISTDTMLTLRSLNGATVTLRPEAAAAVISYVATNWLVWYHHNSGDDVAGVIANNQFVALGRYIYRSGRFTRADIAAISRYTD